MKVTRSCPTLCDHMDSTGYEIFQARILEWVAFPFSRVSSQPRDRTQVSLIAGGFFTSWATRKSKTTAVGSLSLLYRIFPTQELNQGLLYCRWILYQLSCQSSGRELMGGSRPLERKAHHKGAGEDSWESLGQQGGESKTVSRSVVSVCDPMDCSPPGSPLSKEFPRHEDWSGLPFPSPGNLPDTGTEPRSPALQADSLPSESLGKLQEVFQDKEQ